jgi:hypothetical protein
MKTKVNLWIILFASLIMSGLMFSSALAWTVAEDVDACGKKMTDARKVQRALDIAEIQNVASMHEYYHNVLAHGQEVEAIWAKKTPDLMWTNNNDKYIGADFIKFYVDVAKAMSKDLSGMLAYHMLTTPVIVVAGDGKTAKAVWMSFGEISGNMGGKGTAMWTQEKYGMDFVKEDGKWKIWHLRTYVDFYSDTKGSWLDEKSNLNASSNESKDSGAAVKEEPGVNFDMAKPTEKGNYYTGYTLKTVPAFNPKPPESYCTWKDTYAY